MDNLIFLLFLFVLIDLEVAQFVALLGVRHDPQPVPEVVLLQVLLGQILQVPARNTEPSKNMKSCWSSRQLNHYSNLLVVCWKGKLVLSCLEGHFVLLDYFH